MGIEDLPLDDEELIVQNELTVAELKDMFGREATRRGLEYMQSLHRADTEFKKSAKPRDLDEGWEKAFDVEEGEINTEASSEWADTMKERGLDLDDG